LAPLNVQGFGRCWQLGMFQCCQRAIIRSGISKAGHWRLTWQQAENLEVADKNVFKQSIESNCKIK